jgi:hypothetical protein
MAPGRVVIGIATGDSAVGGLTSAKPAELREYIVALNNRAQNEVRGRARYLCRPISPW